MRVLNASEIIPVSASYVGDDYIKFNGNDESVTTNDGYSYIKSDIINSLIDVKYNKYSFFGLTSGMDMTDLVSDASISINTKGPLAISIDDDSSSMLGVDSQYEFTEVDLYDDDCVMYSFEHIETDGVVKYYKISYRDVVVTLDDDGIMYLDDYSELDSQIFKLIYLSGDRVLIVAKNEVVALSPFESGSSVMSLKDSLGNNIISSDITTTFDGYTTSNKWVRYDDFYAPEYSTNSSILYVDDENSLYGVKTNFLLNCPCESISINGSVASIPFDIIPTKNFKTINSELSLIATSGLSGADLVSFRDYRRIYTGGSQIDGYSNINLGYTSEYSSVITFKGDDYTYFHFPITAPEVSIQEAGFEYAGAFAGIIPEYSDRIYKRLSNYSDKVWWGGGSQNGVQNGTWLCSWLSGSDDDSVWIERYYNPGKVTVDYALSMETTGAVDVIEFTVNDSPVQDIVSTMTLEPGAYYKYYHVGDSSFDDIVDSLVNSSNGELVIKLSDFTTSDIVNDESDNNNDGYISNYDGIDEVTLDIGFGSEEQSAILLNGNSEIQVNASTTLNITENKSISSWIYSRDWTSGRSTTLFSNYYKGGDKFEYMNHGLYYSYMIPNAESGSERFTIMPTEISASDQMITYDQVDGVPVSVAVDLDGFHWVSTYISPSDSDPDGQTLLFKLTSSGKVLESISINPSEFGEISQLIIKDDNVGYLVDVDGTVRDFNLYDGSFISSETTIPSGNFAYINTSGEFDSISGDVIDLDQFDDGTLCTIQDDGDLGIRVHIGDVIQPEFDNETFKHIVCDDDLYYFVTSYTTSGVINLYKYNKDDDSVVQSFSMAAGSDSLNIPFITKETIDSVLSTVVYWVGGYAINKYYINSDSELEYVESFGTDGFSGTINGDLSGYKLNKVINTLNGSIPYLKYSAILEDSSSEVRKVVMIHGSEDLADNWHHFVIVKDSYNENLNLYIDGVLSETIQSVSGSILYSTGSMLNLGGVSDGSDSLFETLGVSGLNIDGGYSEFAIFDAVLSADDVSSLYISKFTGNDSMEWVVNNIKKDFVEEIQNIFKFKKPGIKSQFLNVIIKNLDLTEDEQTVYEALIRATISDLLSANIKLKDVIWR